MKQETDSWKYLLSRPCRVENSNEVQNKIRGASYQTNMTKIKLNSTHYSALNNNIEVYEPMSGNVDINEKYEIARLFQIYKKRYQLINIAHRTAIILSEITELVEINTKESNKDFKTESVELRENCGEVDTI